MKWTRNKIWILLLCAVPACNKSNLGNGGGGGNVPNVTIAKGADVSWLTEMENAGRKFYNAAGAEQDCMVILKNLGVTAIRLRVWVDPAGGWNNIADVVAKARRATNLGLKILIDFHYSDSWSDAGQQTKPASWAAQNFATLQQSVYDHTYTVLNTLKANGVTPDWVQVGNETNDGLLWPSGRASTSMADYAALFNKGYDAIKAVDPGIKVIVHLSNGWDNALFRWNLDGLKSNGGKFDIIGMSLYPDPGTWTTLNTQCLTNMKDMVTRYDKPVMIVEVGMSWDQASACEAFLYDLTIKVKSLGQGIGLGVFYWEPQSYNNWKSYTKGAFDNSGKPTTALNAFN